MEEIDYVKTGQCLHRELFGGTWQQSWLHDRFLELAEATRHEATVPELVRKGLLREELPDVYSTMTFSKRFCDIILKEIENFMSYCDKHGVAIHRPNSMNRYGVVLNLMGMKPVLTHLQQQFFVPISRALFPIEGSNFSDHHTFIISYNCAKDKALDMHTDDSDVTWNICLGKEGFIGSGLTFCGQIADADHRKYSGSYTHELGRAVIHLGQRRHGADNILSGDRHNIVMWCKNNDYRNSDLFERRMRRYEKESGPPDPRCLSYTHDRDYIAFKDYPSGCNPYSIESDMESDEDSSKRAEDAAASPSQEQSLPWCPPTKFGYDGMFSQNKLMLIHFQKEVAKEEERKSKKLKIEDS